MSAKKILTLAIVSMLALALCAAPAFADPTYPSPAQTDIFYVWGVDEEDEPVLELADEMATHMVLNSVYEDGVVYILFKTSLQMGPGAPYTGEIFATADRPVEIGDEVNNTVTISYEADPDEYVELDFDIYVKYPDGSVFQHVQPAYFALVN
ncbi:MAG: hypothetical protein LBS10_09120 [Gracilibacteraceae bacterium]|jgi:hypothetical protein|nr:hypothetical protein [Gracilibacteraceae bacterium]